MQRVQFVPGAICNRCNLQHMQHGPEGSKICLSKSVHRYTPTQTGWLFNRDASFSYGGVGGLDYIRTYTHSLHYYIDSKPTCMPSHQTLISQQFFYLDPVLLLDNHNLMSKLCSKDSWSRSTSDRLSSPILHRLWRLQCKCNPSRDSPGQTSCSYHPLMIKWY